MGTSALLSNHVIFRYGYDRSAGVKHFGGPTCISRLGFPNNSILMQGTLLPNLRLSEPTTS
jgi:hypothetical protein